MKVENLVNLKQAILDISEKLDNLSVRQVEQEQNFLFLLQFNYANSKLFTIILNVMTYVVILFFTMVIGMVSLMFFNIENQMVWDYAPFVLGSISGVIFAHIRISVKEFVIKDYDILITKVKNDKTNLANQYKKALEELSIEDIREEDMDRFKQNHFNTTYRLTFESISKKFGWDKEFLFDFIKENVVNSNRMVNQ